MNEKLPINDPVARALRRMGISIGTIVGIGRMLAEDYELLLNLLLGEKGGYREGMGIRDRCIVVKLNEDGEIVEKRDTGWSLNGITNAGLALVAGLLLTDVGGTPFDYIAIGTGTNSFSPSQTALVSEVKRKAGTGSRVTTSVTNDTAQLVASFSSADGLTGSHAIAESGVFNAGTGGTMLCRQTFAVLNINWDQGDSLQVTWKIQIKQAT